MRGQIVCKLVEGTGADINVELGFVPDAVFVVNAAGATKAFYHAQFHNPAIKFDDADAGEIKVGDFLESAGDGAGYVREVVLKSGSWDIGGGGVGYIVFEQHGFVPGWDNNDVINRGGVNVGDVVDTSDDGVGNVGGTFAANELLVPYHGATGSNSKGFTIKAAAAVDGDLLRVTAIREGE